MQTLRRDLTYALRTWTRRPAAIGTAMLTLALGIGANTTIFSIVSGVLLKPLPYAEPDRLVMVWRDARARGGPEREWASPGHLVDWQARGAAFDLVAAVRGWGPTVTGEGEAERLSGAAVSRAYFEMLGVPPLHGRTFTSDEDRPGSGPVAVVSHVLWERRFGRDPSIIGRSVVLDGTPTTIVGVMPSGFRPPVVDAEIWSPIRIGPANAQRGLITLRVLARLAPGVTLEQARSTAGSLVDPGDPDDRQITISLVPLHDDIVGPVKRLLVVLLGSVVFVLLIACVNVANLLLARATERAREIAVRLALGASRRDITRQLMVESLLLGTVGGALGLVLAWWGLQALLAAAPATAPRLRDVRIDLPVLLFTIGASAVSAVLAGLAPALITTRSQLTPSLKDGGREGTSGSRLRSLLVVVEVALAMALVAGAGLLVRSLIALQRTDLGITPGRVLTASVAPPRGSYRDDASVRQLHAQLLEQARAIPGVEQAATTTILPLALMNTDFSFEIVGRPEPPGGEPPSAWFRVTSPDYFSTIGMRIVEGRGLATTDTADAPGAVVVNETLARRYWPGASPVGARIRTTRLEATVVGVVADTRHRGPMQPPDAEMFLSSQQMPSRAVVLVLRTRGEPASVVPALREAVRRIDPLLPLANVATMNDLLDRNLSQPRFLTVILGGFSVLAAVLALVGVYGVLAFNVSRRSREIGVRMALGAGRRSVVRLVLRQSLMLTGTGILAGLALAAVLSRGMRGLLYGVAPGDPATLLVMAVIICVAAVAASYAPARRASLVDPVVALRDE